MNELVRACYIVPKIDDPVNHVGHDISCSYRFALSFFEPIDLPPNLTELAFFFFCKGV